MKKTLILNFLVVFIFILWMAPFFWMLWGAFVPTSVITGVSDASISKITAVNFIETFRRKNWLGGLINSVTIALVSTLVIIFIGSVCAFGISRWKRNDKTFSLWLLSTRMLPPASILVAFLFYFRILNLIDTWSGLVLANIAINLGLFILLLKAYMDNQDRAFEEILRTQGATLWKSFLMTTYWKLKMPVLFSAMLCFLFCWNEFLLASSFTAGGNSETLPVIVSGFITGQDVMWGPMFASCTLMVLPAIIAMWFLEKTLLKGLTFGIVEVD
jgi:multiple sugar transport system permease protein